jgi:N-acetylglucosaminyldiphosphoundecaprenol N-acetyl-beta-D-mannosaminyltransferase
MSNGSNTVSLQEQEIEKPADGRTSGRVPPIFVIGVWRSGTTLLYSLLNQHPDIRLFYESDLPVLWPMFKFSWMRKAWVEKWEYWNAGVSRHDLDPEQLAPPVNTLAEAAEMAGRKYAAQKGKTRWGCKSPSYYDRLVDLAREFPHARFVVIWRDPEEVCSSVIRASTSGQWFGRPGTTHKALLACRTLKTQCDKMVALGAFIHQIHYRDLVEDPTTTMRGVCEFLQVPFTEAVTVLNKADRSAVFEGAHHALARSGQIVAKKERDDNTLPADLKNKIRQYKALWKEQFGDHWLLSRHFTETGETKPAIGDRAKNQLWYRALRAWDIAPRVIFSVLPTSFWQTYRRLKYKDSGWVHNQLTKKPTTLHNHASGAQAPTGPGAEPCAVRLGRIRLQSVDLESLLSNSGSELKHVVTVHSEIFVCAHEDPAFEAILKRTVNTIDGRIIQFWCSLLYPGRNLQKRSGSDFIYDLSDHASKRGERIFLLGADAESNQGTIKVLKQRCPDLAVEGYSPAFCGNIQQQEWNEDILDRIARFRPTHLVVCFGPVKQEMWISQNAGYLFQLGVRCAYGLGGTLDFVSGRKKRAPKWIQAAGAEWLFRLFTEPQRIGRTAKMFKMPYYACRYHKREVELLSGAETTSFSSPPSLEARAGGVLEARFINEERGRQGLSGNQQGVPEKYVTISVDDGHPTDLRTVDLLQKYGLKATFYIPGANEERIVMTPREIREIDQHFEVGSHTLNHLRLTPLSAQDSWQEILDGKKFSEDTVGHEVVSFCYPGGKFNRRVAAQVAKAGFLAGRTCMYFLNDFPEDPLCWGISAYANTYPAYVQVRHCLLEYNFAGAYNYLTTFKARTAWSSQFRCALDHVSREGGIAHLYFHSWEIDQNGEWDELEAVFKGIAQHSLTPVTNGDVYRRWYEKRGLVSSTPRASLALPR